MSKTPIAPIDVRTYDEAEQAIENVRAASKCLMFVSDGMSFTARELDSIGEWVHDQLGPIRALLAGYKAVMDAARADE